MSTLPCAALFIGNCVLLDYTMQSRPPIAIANAFSVYDGANGDCGLLKWCYNAIQLLRMPWLAGRSEVVIWTNPRGADFVRTECGARVDRIVLFDNEMVQLARRWAKSTSNACGAAGRRCHLGLTSVNDVAVLKWQLVRHEEYRLIFLTDTDLDIFDMHYAKSEAEYQWHMQLAWTMGLDAFIGNGTRGSVASASAVEQRDVDRTYGARRHLQYANGTHVIANPDFESPINAGVMLIKPSARSFQLGVDALSTMRWNLSHGFGFAGSPCAGVPDKMIKAFTSNGLKRCTWNFLGANTDQGLFWYVYGVQLRSIARSRYKGYAVKHFWAYYKPWRQSSGFWCRRWYDFMDNGAAFEHNDTRCAQDLGLKRRAVQRLNVSHSLNRCRGVWSRVF